ncbi:unnamed protein product [Didymodactylos carnosus]|uniref:OTU domain-containing protein n=1 Tax=Didymodactylos carnosus TaxID=1234261 RepID=A0A8S2RI48_9BILA|nr:unnamed protein product [Didymodactylos carnosus]CAF4162127.1 unnamed protein product [Didymodactylos carnosus]
MYQHLRPYSYSEYQDIFKKSNGIVAQLERFVSLETNTLFATHYTTALKLDCENINKISPHLFENQSYLENSQIINWFSKCAPLYSLKTNGEGNCLLDACLLHMIGIQDSSLTLRHHLLNYIKTNERAIHDRWRYSRVSFDQKLGIDLEDHIMEKEWNDIIAETEVVDGRKCKFLQSCHIFSTANMLKRPIIVLGHEFINTVNECNVQLNDLVGIYLPLLSTASNTIHYPIVLGYTSNHFTPLVMRENQSSDLTSLCSYLPLSFLSSSINTLLLRDLPVHYLNYLEENNINNLLKKYLVIDDIQSDSGEIVRCCALSEERLPEHVNALDKYIQYLKENLPDEVKMKNPPKQSDMDTDPASASTSTAVFCVGDTFHSFEEFKRKLNNYSSETGAMFSIGHSTKLKHTSELVYETIVFYCCHGGKIRNRSNGIRPQQHHLCLQCPVKIRLQSNGTTLKITVINLNHNHKVDQSNLKFYARHRRLDNDTIELIKKYDNHKVPRNIIRDMVMNENKDKFTTVKGNFFRTGF